MRAMLAVCTLCSTFLLFVTTASADDIGPIGSIVKLELYTSSAETFLAYNGRLFVKDMDGNLNEYRWGGIACGTKVLTDTQFAALQAAQNNKKMMIQPFTLAGQNSACLVGFQLVEKKNLKLFP